MVAIATPSAARIEREPTTPLYELIRDVAALAALPRACLRVMEIGDKQRGAAREMVEVITCDPALTRQLLKLINSAYCGFPQPVAHLADAVELIGTRRLRNLTLAAGALSAFNGITTPLLDRKAFWHASVHCGLMARALARWLWRSCCNGGAASRPCFMSRAGIAISWGCNRICSARTRWVCATCC